MSAQTATAHKYGAEPVTPVIIKTGGDDEDPKSAKLPGHHVSIESAMAFAETVAGPTWASSQSTSNGRIVEVNVMDGSTPVSYKPTSRNKLTSVTIEFGLARLIAMESGVAALNDVLLLLTSPEIPFTPGKIGHWHSSKAHFPQQITKVTVMEGDRQAFTHKCENADVTVQISFDLN
jgi:hypothetical protein